MHRIARVLVVFALVAAGCSGEVETETFGTTPETTGSTSVTALVDALKQSIFANPDRRFDEATTECLIAGLVDEFGEDGLAELGVTRENPDLEGGAVFATPDAARRAVDVGMECVDLANVIGSNLPADTSLLEDSVECVAAELKTDTFRDFFADLIAAGAEPSDIMDYGAAQLSIGTLLVTCLSPEELLRFDELIP